MKKTIYLIMPLIFMISSCEHDPLYTPIDDNPDENVIVDDNCDPDKVYFVNDVLPTINANCAFSGCHGGGSAQDGVDLSTYNGIMEQITAGNAFSSDLYEAITDNDPADVMPPSPYNPLSAEQIATIRDWINQGATNEVCADCDLTNVTFAQSVWPIIQNSCTGCHSGTTPQGNLSLTNYAEVAQIAQNGYLSGVINHDAGFVAMPLNGQQLSTCDIDTIENWISQGYPDN